MPPFTFVVKDDMHANGVTASEAEDRAKWIKKVRKRILGFGTYASNVTGV